MTTQLERILLGYEAPSADFPAEVVAHFVQAALDARSTESDGVIETTRVEEIGPNVACLHVRIGANCYLISIEPTFLSRMDLA